MLLRETSYRQLSHSQSSTISSLERRIALCTGTPTASSGVPKTQLMVPVSFVGYVPRRAMMAKTPRNAASTNSSPSRPAAPVCDPDLAVPDVERLLITLAKERKKPAWLNTLEVFNHAGLLFNGPLGKNRVGLYLVVQRLVSSVLSTLGRASAKVVSSQFD